MSKCPNLPVVGRFRHPYPYREVRGLYLIYTIFLYLTKNPFIQSRDASSRTPLQKNGQRWFLNFMYVKAYFIAWKCEKLQVPDLFAKGFIIFK